MRRLDRRSVGEIIQRGGTFLRTARCLEFMKPEVQKKAADFLRSRDIDALVVIGGDGSMKGAEAISTFGMPTVVIPGTIDGDMLGTDYTVGFDTAVNTVLASVNKIRDTAFSHDRVAVIEVMGRPPCRVYCPPRRHGRRSGNGFDAGTSRRFSFSL